MQRTFALLSVLTLTALGCSDGPHKARIGASCAADADCDSGLCYQSLCVDPDADDDGDTLTNGIEAALGTNPYAADSDGDGASDAAELDASLNNIDSDGDGRPDALESRTADADHDCLVDELDPHDGDPSDGAGDPRVATLCPTAGVCGAAGAVLALACPTDPEHPVCAFTGVPGYHAVDDSCDGADDDCDGVPDDDGACTPHPGGCEDLVARDDGRYPIDPDGLAGPYAPFEVECLFSVERGDWTRLDAAFDAALTALAGDAPREYLLLGQNGGWYRSPITATTWDWAAGATVPGLWVHADGEGALGAFDCPAGAAGAFGVGCAVTGGPAVLPTGTPDAAGGTLTLCQTGLAAVGPGCVDGVAVYVRLPRCVPDPGQLLTDGGFADLARGDSCWWAAGDGEPGQGFSFPDDVPPGGTAPSVRADNPTLGNDIWALQLLEPGLTFIAGRTYRATFWAKAGEERTVRVFVQSRDLAVPFYYADVTVGVAWAELSLTFTAANSSWDGMFEFQLGEVSTAPVWLDDVRLVDLSAATTTRVMDFTP